MTVGKIYVDDAKIYGYVSNPQGRSNMRKALLDFYKCAEGLGFEPYIGKYVV